MAEKTLTDDELRKELQKYGHNVGPITASTRDILRKKLNHLKASDNRSRRPPPGGRRGQGPVESRKLSGFSSDESEVESSFNTSRGRRSGTTRAQRKDDSKQVTDRRPKGHRLSLLRTVTKRDVDLDASTASAGIQTSFIDDSIASLDITQSTDGDFDHLDDPSGFINSDSDDELDLRPNQTRGGNRSYLDQSAVLDSTGYDDSIKSESPDSNARYLSSIDKSVLRPSIRPRRSAAFTPKNEYKAECRNNHSGNHIKTNHKDSSEEDKILKQGFKTYDDSHNFTSGQYVSMFLLFLAGLFFIFLTVLYVSRTSSTSTSKDNWLLSNEEEDSLDEDLVRNIHGFIINLVDTLPVRRGLASCGYHPSENMTGQEVVDILNNQYQHLTHLKQPLLAAYRLISANPHWDLKLYDGNGDELSSVVTTEQVHWLVSTDISIPWMCWLTWIGYWIIYIFLFILTVSLGSGLVILGTRYYWRKKEEESQRLYETVEQIIDVLKSNHDASERDQSIQPYMAIAHVRDMLIPPKDRKRLKPLWDKAVKFLTANESRIRLENQMIRGEDFAVWRWLPAYKNGNKCWQGQAFGERKDIPMNSPPNSLTPCLKIRNMFEAEIETGANWTFRISDAILEKAGENHGIVHIKVDEASKEGCVFVKCQSSSKAGNVYKALHGWWFDGKLVTVKYLRLERYHERFPEAAALCSETLHPTNDECLSMSRPYHRSVTEVS